jgi:DNA-directed RNA polymerase subunit RPC12/RpoP
MLTFFSMISFMYRCPRTGLKVQGHAADDLINGEAYEPVTCTACGGTHLVNPKTGRVLEQAKK